MGNFESTKSAPRSTIMQPNVRSGQQRVSAVIPVTVGGTHAGMTRDISPSGIFFETDAKMSAGAPIHFSVTFDSPPGKLRLECTGEIDRIDDLGGGTGVAGEVFEARPRKGA